MNNLYTKKRTIGVIGIILSLFLICSLHGRAQGLTITPTNPQQTISKGTDYTYDSGVLTVKTATSVTIAGKGSTTTDCIVVPTGTQVEITLKNVLIDVKVQPGKCAFDIQGNASVTLILNGVNSMISYYGSHGTGLAGIHYPKDASLTIKGSGSLEAKGGYSSAGIGGNNVNSSGEAAGTLEIKGGTITATGGYDAPGIGESAFGNGGKVIISGGTIIATSEAMSNGHYIGIYCDYICFPPGGNALVIADLIEPRKDKESNPNDYKNSWNGVIFENINTSDTPGKVYGNTVTLGTDATIPSGKTLTIEDGKTLVIGAGTTLTNEGTITNNGELAVEGTLTNDATYQGSGDIKLEGGTVGGSSSSSFIFITFDGNAGGDPVFNLPFQQVLMPSGGHASKPDKTPLRTDYALVGWSTTAGGAVITDWSTIAADANKTLYARWKYNTKLVFTYSYTYGEIVPTVSATPTGAEAGPSPEGNVSYSFYSDAACTKAVSGTPTDAGTYYVKAFYTGDANNMSAEATTTYTITSKKLTVTPVAGQSIYSDEHPAYTVSDVVGSEKPAFTGNLQVSEGRVVDGGLTLSNGASGFKAANYTWGLSSEQVAITQDSKTLAEAYTAEAAAISSAVGTGKHDQAVVLKPSVDFKIKGSFTLKKSSGEWLDQLIVDGADGNHEVKYQLKRMGRVGDWDNKTAPSAEQTFTVLLDKTPSLPVPPVAPEITYMVSLPGVEGVATDPAAGDYEVTSWSSFLFGLTLDAAYSQSAPIVTTDRGETLKPRASDGKYQIKYVRSNVSILISGIVKNPDPVANETIDTAVQKVYAAGGMLYVRTEAAAQVNVFNMQGRLLKSVMVSGETRMPLPQGIYIVRLNDRNYKVRISE